MRPDPSAKKALGFFILFSAALCLSAYLIFMDISQPKGRLYCYSFGSYADMHSYFTINKAAWLDKDSDGIPCENRFKI